MSAEEQAKLEKILSKIKYKDGWEFTTGVREHRLYASVRCVAAEQDPKNRTGRPFNPSEALRQWEDTHHYEEPWLDRGLAWRNPVATPPPVAVVTRDVFFFPGEIDSLPTEVIVLRIFDTVYEMEIHELKEFFRYDGLCVQEPHPEAPRKLAFQKGGSDGERSG